MNELLKEIPQVDAVLRLSDNVLGSFVTARLVREEIEKARDAAAKGTPSPGANEIAAAVDARAEHVLRSRLGKVVNATGVVLHTNLGRAPLSRDAIDSAAAASGATALEIDTASGKRGVRAPFGPFLAAALTGAESAHIVNNNAAALVLALAALAKGREVIVSRGEMIEIGGEFRLPELMESSGAILREVGTTNRTHAKDYRNAINDRTALILKVHPSNYRVVGFTAAPSMSDVVAIAREAGVPLMYDIGSGLLGAAATMPDEPDARSAIEEGADLISFSADKLLGGPQAGILAGRADLVGRCKRNPLARAMRADKLTLGALEATLLAHARGEELPVKRMLAADTDEIRARAERVAAGITAASVIDGETVAGGGSAPGETIPTALVAVVHDRPQELKARLAEHAPPVIATVDRARLVLDLRTVTPEDDEIVAAALRNALQ